MGQHNMCGGPVATWDLLRRGVPSEVRQFMYHRLVCLGLISVLLAGERGVAQTPSSGAPRLTVRPHEMATGTKSTVSALHSLDSFEDYLIYVPRRCVGARRCPLVVYLSGGDIGKERMYLHLPEAEKYGMILLATGPSYHETLDRALQQILGKFAIDPGKIALAGYWDEGTNALSLGYTNLDIFSRIAALSPGPVVYDTAVGPRNQTTQFFIAAAVDWPAQLAASFQAAHELRQAGHAVKLVLSFRGQMGGVRAANDYPFLWRWLHESWATPTPAAHTAPSAVTVADSLPLLTTEALSRWTTFWTRFITGPDSLRMTARRAYQKEVSVPVGQTQVSIMMMNIPALAAKYPAVAADLKAAGLTAGQAEAYRIALLSAKVTGDLGWADSVAATSVLRKNLEFLTTHAKELEVFSWPVTEMWYTP